MVERFYDWRRLFKVLIMVLEYFEIWYFGEII